MVNRRRITAALIGLIVLVFGGWIVHNVVSGGGPGSPAGVSGTQFAGTPPSTLPPEAAGSGSPTGVSGTELGATPLSTLPPEAADTWKLVLAGGPYPYPANDDVVFGNREKRLPVRGPGYYHEYTVKTPGSPDRGARRLIVGRSREVFYTGDHYLSFVVVDPNR